MKIAVPLFAVILVSCAKVVPEKDARIETLTGECNSLRTLVEELQAKIRDSSDEHLQRIAELERMTDWQMKELQAIQTCLRKSPELTQLFTIEELRAHGREKQADVTEQLMWDAQGMDKKAQELIRKVRKEAAEGKK